MSVARLALSALVLSQTIGCVAATPPAPKRPPASGGVAAFANGDGSGDVFGPAPTTPEWVEVPRVTITAPSATCVYADRALRDRGVSWSLFAPRMNLGADPMPMPIDIRGDFPEELPPWPSTRMYSGNAYDIADQSPGVAAALDDVMTTMGCTVRTPLHLKIGFLEGRTLPSATLVLAGKAPRCLEAALTRVCSRPGFADVLVTPSRGAVPWRQKWPPFGRDDVIVSLARIDVTSCNRPDGPVGAGHVNVTFRPSGTVSAVEVDRPPFSGTPVGGCVAAKFRDARVRPFSGGAVTVGSKFTIP